MTGRPTPQVRAENDDEVIAEMQSRIRWWGDQTRLAKEIGVQPCRLSNIIHGKARVSDRIAAGLGFRKRVRWERSD